MKKQGIIFDIKRFAIHDGPGIRTTIFFKGCSLNCFWCHNPESQKKEPEEMVWEDRKRGNVSKKKTETVGKRVSVAYIIEEIEKDNIFYDESEGGVTFSGGEPLVQPEFLALLLDACKKRGIHTAMDTSGHGSTEIFSQLMNKTDLFLYDLKFMDNQEHIKYTGLPNGLILENLKLLSKNKKRTIIRFAVIPGITDSKKNVTQMARFISSLEHVNEVDLLPFHRGGEAKYGRMKKKSRITDIQPPSETDLKKTKRVFESFDLNVKIGG